MNEVRIDPGKGQMYVDDQDDKVEPYWLAQGKEVVDMLYDKHYLDNELTRDSMTELDEYFGFLFHSYVESAVKVDRLIRKIRGEKND